MGKNTSSIFTECCFSMVSGCLAIMHQCSADVLLLADVHLPRGSTYFPALRFADQFYIVFQSTSDSANNLVIPRCSLEKQRKNHEKPKSSHFSATGRIPREGGSTIGSPCLPPKGSFTCFFCGCQSKTLVNCGELPS